jgi:hypothetical protein
MKYLLAIFVFITAFCGTALLSHLDKRGDDLSLRYNLWKTGLWPAPDHLAWSLYVDGSGSFIRGMSKDEIKALFPGAHEGPAHEGEWLHDYEERYVKWDIRGQEHLWLDYNEIVVFFKNGRAKSMSLMHG